MATRFHKSADELLTMLASRRDDPTFWQPVTEILREITRRALASPGRAVALPPGAKLLATWDPDQLAQRLRDALPQAEAIASPDGPARRADRMFRPGEPIPAALLAALLLLGLSMAACDSDSDPGTGGGGGAAGQMVGTAGHGGTSSTTGGTRATGGNGQAGAPTTSCPPTSESAIYSAIAASTLSAQDQQTLHQCLVNLRASWCEGLTELFATRTQAEIASTLQELVFCCHVNPSKIDQEWAAAYQQLLAGALCPVVLYKGVSFPD